MTSPSADWITTAPLPCPACERLSAKEKVGTYRCKCGRTLLVGYRATRNKTESTGWWVVVAPGADQ